MSSRSVLVTVGATSLEIVCFPGDDPSFESAVRRIITELEQRGPHRDVAEALATGLAAQYPAVRIQPRHPLASWDPTGSTLYAFRDGTKSTTSNVDAATPTQVTRGFRTRTVAVNAAPTD